MKTRPINSLSSVCPSPLDIRITSKACANCALLSPTVVGRYSCRPGNPSGYRNHHIPQATATPEILIRKSRIAPKRTAWKPRKRASKTHRSATSDLDTLMLALGLAASSSRSPGEAMAMSTRHVEPFPSHGKPALNAPHFAERTNNKTAARNYRQSGHVESRRGTSTSSTQTRGRAAIKLHYETLAARDQHNPQQLPNQQRQFPINEKPAAI